MYFIKRSAAYYTPKNKLHEAAVRQITEKYNRCTVSPEDVPKLFEQLDADLEQLNVEHNRCKPLHASYGKDGEFGAKGTDYYWTVYGVIKLNFYNMNHQIFPQ